MNNSNMTVYDVVKKLIGKIEPIGETNEDDRRFENLKVTTELIDKLLTDVDNVILNKKSDSYSLKRAGEYADKFMTQIGIAE